MKLMLSNWTGRSLSVAPLAPGTLRIGARGLILGCAARIGVDGFSVDFMVKSIGGPARKTSRRQNPQRRWLESVDRGGSRDPGWTCLIIFARHT